MEIDASGMRLSSLRQGECAVVEGYHCPGVESCQLEAMGMRVGALVTMLMPGCPCAVAIEDTRLMVTQSLLDGVLVSPLE